MRHDRFPGGARMLAFVVVVATAALIALLIHRYGVILMKRFALFAVVALALAGCASGAGKQVLTNLQGCERHYDGVVSAGMGAAFSGSVKIDCAPSPAP